jgi:hypothetical protein
MNTHSLRFKKKTYINSPTLSDLPRDDLFIMEGKLHTKKDQFLFQTCPFFTALDVASLHSGSNIPSTAIADDVLYKPSEKLLDSNFKPDFK